MPKGVFFSLDTIFAIVLAITMVLAINFFLLRVQQDPVKDLYIEKFANDVLFTMVKNKTFENPNSTTVANAFADILPENLGGVLNVKLYQCVGPSCSSFNKTSEYSVDKCRINVVDVVLVMDRSGSMAGQQLADAKAAAKTFVDQLDSFNDRSGLVSFSTTATLNQNLTFNKNSVKASIDSLSASGFTAIGDGIQNATNHLVWVGRGSTKWSQVLLSDGQNNRGVNPITAANNARDEGIIIYTIGLGSDADNTTLSNIANITGGKYFFAPTGSDLNKIYLEIAKELLVAQQEVSLARTSFVTFQGTTVREFGIAELRMCII